MKLTPTAEALRKLNWKAIAAMSLNRVIGKDGRLPWSIPGDLQWVKQCTQSHAIAMGRKTFASMGRPLPGRTNIVLSRHEFAHPQCIHLRSLEELMDFSFEGTIWIFGGAGLYKDALPWTSELLLTVVAKEVDGDTFFPEFEHQFHFVETIKTDPLFEIHRYRNNLL